MNWLEKTRYSPEGLHKEKRSYEGLGHSILTPSQNDEDSRDSYDLLWDLPLDPDIKEEIRKANEKAKRDGDDYLIDMPDTLPEEMRKEIEAERESLYEEENERKRLLIELARLEGAVLGIKDALMESQGKPEQEEIAKKAQKKLEELSDKLFIVKIEVNFLLPWSAEVLGKHTISTPTEDKVSARSRLEELFGKSRQMDVREEKKKVDEILSKI